MMSQGLLPTKRPRRYTGRVIAACTSVCRFTFSNCDPCSVGLLRNSPMIFRFECKPGCTPMYQIETVAGSKPVAWLRDSPPSALSATPPASNCATFHARGLRLVKKADSTTPHHHWAAVLRLARVDQPPDCSALCSRLRFRSRFDHISHQFAQLQPNGWFGALRLLLLLANLISLSISRLLNPASRRKFTAKSSISGRLLDFTAWTSIASCCSWSAKHKSIASGHSTGSLTLRSSKLKSADLVLFEDSFDFQSGNKSASVQ